MTMMSLWKLIVVMKLKMMTLKKQILYNKLNSKNMISEHLLEDINNNNHNNNNNNNNIYNEIINILSDDDDEFMEIDCCYEIKDDDFKKTNSINKLNSKNMISEHLLEDINNNNHNNNYNNHNNHNYIYDEIITYIIR